MYIFISIPFSVETILSRLLQKYVVGNVILKLYMCVGDVTNCFSCLAGRLRQSVKCLVTDACLTANPGVAS